MYLVSDAACYALYNANVVRGTVNTSEGRKTSAYIFRGVARVFGDKLAGREWGEGTGGEMDTGEGGGGGMVVDVIDIAYRFLREEVIRCGPYSAARTEYCFKYFLVRPKNIFVTRL